VVVVHLDPVGARTSNAVVVARLDPVGARTSTAVVVTVLDAGPVRPVPGAVVPVVDTVIVAPLDRTRTGAVATVVVADIVTGATGGGRAGLDGGPSAYGGHLPAVVVEEMRADRHPDRDGLGEGRVADHPDRRWCSGEQSCGREQRETLHGAPVEVVVVDHQSATGRIATAIRPWY
jgi:hypothetical protein